MKVKPKAFNSTRVSPEKSRLVKGSKQSFKTTATTVKTRKPPMSAKPRDPVKDKENVQPLYLSKKNKGSKIGKGSFLKSLEPSTFYDKKDDA